MFKDKLRTIILTTLVATALLTGIAFWVISQRPKFTAQEAATLRTQFAYETSHPRSTDYDVDLAAVADEQRNSYLHTVMEDVRTNIAKGQPIYICLAKHPDIFDARYCDVMKQAQKVIQRSGDVEQGHRIIMAQILHQQGQ